MQGILGTLQQLEKRCHAEGVQIAPKLLELGKLVANFVVAMKPTEHS